MIIIQLLLKGGTSGFSVLVAFVLCQALGFRVLAALRFSIQALHVENTSLPFACSQSQHPHGQDNSGGYGFWALSQVRLTQENTNVKPAAITIMMPTWNGSSPKDGDPNVDSHILESLL